jgi:CubicO group peptidase (beta-lactamase class C family)
MIRLALIAAALAASTVRAEEPQMVNGCPVNGKAPPGSEPLDKAVTGVMKRHGIPGAALAIAKDGKLLIARGYGWANLENDTFVKPDTLFGIASLSKTITAAAVLKLVEQGKLKLDDHAFKLLAQIKPFRGLAVDPRLHQITVRHLLHHAGGWDHAKSGDPVNWTTRLQYERKDKLPVSPQYLISEAMTLKLDFEPGTESKYSNFGFIVLGEVIEKASGTTYEKYVKEHVLKPAGMTGASLHPLNEGYFKNEARRYLAGQDTELPPWRQKYSDAAGGWAVSAVDMVRLLTALDGTRGKPLLGEAMMKEMLATPPKIPARPDGTHVGLGWDTVVLKEKEFGYFKDGNWFGMRSFMRRQVNGVNAVLLFNASLQPDSQDLKSVGDAAAEVRKHLESIEAFAAGEDLFKTYP